MDLSRLLQRLVCAKRIVLGVEPMNRRPARHSNGLVAAGLVGFMALMAAYPVYAATRQSKVGEEIRTR